MTYNLRKSDGTELIPGGLIEEIIDTETISGIGLVGRLSANYGETQSNNFIHLVENFASTNFPENPLKGQLCYKLSEEGAGSLYICVNNATNDLSAAWKKLPLVIVSESEPDGLSFISGDMWYDTRRHAFKMYDDSLRKWLVVGPNDFNNTESIVEEIITNDDSESYICEMDLPHESKGYMITAKIIAKEVSKTNSDVLTKSEMNGWIIKTLINSYNTPNGWIYEFVEEPDYELIGSNSTYNWQVKPEIVDQDGYKFRLAIKGMPSSTTKNISWIGKVDVLKV